MLRRKIVGERDEGGVLRGIAPPKYLKEGRGGKGDVTAWVMGDVIRTRLLEWNGVREPVSGAVPKTRDGGFHPLCGKVCGWMTEEGAGTVNSISPRDAGCGSWNGVRRLPRVSRFERRRGDRTP